MAKSYLDKDGLLYFWQKIKALFTVKADSIKNITRSGTTFTATRADGTTFTFTQQDNNTWNANAVDTAGYVAAPTTSNPNKVWKTNADGVPAWRDDANTTYSEATTSAAGLMSSSDKTKLNGIATGAEVNQNAFSNVKVGSTTIAADGKTDTLELVPGTNVTITPDSTNDKVTINAKDTTYSVATTSADGLMSSDHVYTQLLLCRQGLASYGTCATAAGTAAKVVTVSSGVFTDTLQSGAKIIVKFTVTNTAAVGNLTMVVSIDGTNIGSAKPIKYRGGNLPSAGTLMANRLYLFMYDGTNWEIIGDLDTQRTVDSSLSSSSTNPVQNKVINTAITDLSNNKVSTSAIGAASGVCPLNASAKIDSTYLPSYVDDIIEAYARSGQTELSSTWLATGSATGTVITPETGKIYILMNDSTSYSANTQFRWSGSAYVRLADGGVSEITNAEIDTIVAS